MRMRRTSRSASTVVECALVYPVTFLLIMGLVVGAAGMFRYQETAHLARQGSRYASTHGSQWAKDTGNTAPTPAEIYNQAIVPNAVGLDPNRLSYSVTYNTNNARARSSIVNNELVWTTNTVTVTVTYQWIPEAFLGGVTMTSTSVMPMSY